MLNQVFNAVLQGIHRFDVYSKIFNFNSFALLFGNIILALYGYGLIGFARLESCCISTITCVIYAISAKNFCPNLGSVLSLDAKRLNWF